MVYPYSEDCAKGCEFVAGGWPFRYLVDSHGLSPAGSVSLILGLTGDDILHLDLLAATFVFWFCVVGVRVHFFSSDWARTKVRPRPVDEAESARQARCQRATEPVEGPGSR